MKGTTVFACMASVLVLVCASPAIAQMGACCLDADGSCISIDVADAGECSAIGIFQGAGTSCPASGFCGACCVGGECEQFFIQSFCEDPGELDGQYLGDASSCSFPFEECGACCDTGTGTCDFQLAGDCAGSSDEFTQGASCSGVTCVSSNPCDLFPCLNGGACNPDGSGGYTCKCAPGYTGVNCESAATGACCESGVCDQTELFSCSGDWTQDLACDPNPCAPKVSAVSAWGMAALVLVLLTGLTTGYGVRITRRA